MESFEQQKEKFFSENQNKKLEELVEIIRPLYFSTDSNTAFEFATEMGALRKSLEKQGFQPERYLLWSLIAEGGTLDNPDINQEFDTPDGQIEKFIRTFKKTENISSGFKEVA